MLDLGAKSMSYSFTDMIAAIAAKSGTAESGTAKSGADAAEAEADAMFDLSSVTKNRSPEWVAFFVETMTQFVVHQQSPHDHIDARKADWIINRIDRDGRVNSLVELEFLVKALEVAIEAPERLKTYAIQQIEQTVMTGTGPTRHGGHLRPCSIEPAEVKLLRRILFARAEDGISASEAETLFRIKDATILHNNAPEWPKLFVQAVGSHLIAHRDHTPLSGKTTDELDPIERQLLRFIADESRQQPVLISTP